MTPPVRGVPGRLVVKVCGLRTPADVEAAAAAGVDLVGFVLDPSPRRVSPARAAALAARARALGPASVAVFRRLDAGRLALAARLGVDHVQGLAPPPGPPALLPVEPDGPGLAERLARWDGRLVVVDGSRPGSGRPVDWDRVARAAREAGARVLLAGGLGPDNLAAAVARVRPAGVDASSSLERRPGCKDPARIAAFVQAARAAAPRRPVAGRAPSRRPT